MRLNSETKVIGQNLLLVPYEKKHVDRYNTWMLYPELRKVTASEILTLDEEYVMQRSWRDDGNKCTFIIIDKNKFQKYGNEINAMMGVTNIFIKDREASIGEIEIIIAVKCIRGRKFGWEAVILMMLYGIKYIKIKSYQANIFEDNQIAINMFKKLGFEEQPRIEVMFEEVSEKITFTKDVTEEWVNWLRNQVSFEVDEEYRYVDDCAMTSPSAKSLKDDLAAKLWDVSLKAVGIDYNPFTIKSK